MLLLEVCSGERNIQDLEIFFADVRPYINQLVSRKLKRYRPSGGGTHFDLVMITHIRNRQSGEISKFYTRSKRHYVLNNSDISETINIIFDELRTKFSTFISTSTNVEVIKIVRLDMHIDRYEPIRGSGYVPLPDWINKKKTTVKFKTKITYVSCMLLNQNLETPPQLILDSTLEL